MVTVEDAIKYFEYEIIGAKNLLRFTKSNAEQDKIDICQMALDAIMNNQKTTHESAYQLGYNKGYEDGVAHREKADIEDKKIREVYNDENRTVEYHL